MPGATALSVASCAGDGDRAGSGCSSRTGGRAGFLGLARVSGEHVRSGCGHGGTDWGFSLFGYLGPSMESSTGCLETCRP